MRPHDAGHMLISNPVDVAYLTGFSGGDSYLVVPLQGSRKPLMITDFRYVEEMDAYRDRVDVLVRKRSMTDAVSETLASLGRARVALQADHMTLAERNAIAKKIGERRLVATAGLLLGLRSIKDRSEIALIQRAIQIQERALTALLPTIKPGQTELEIAAGLEAAMKVLGSTRPGFESIVAAGANGSLPHYRPGKARVARGRSLLIDWGATSGGYTGDMTRTFALGTWPPKIKDIYKVVYEAHMLVAEALGPGKTTLEIDAIARGCITRAGYGEFFGHGLGHGIGLNVHEEPRLSHMLPGRPLEPGHVVTNEPGIYLPGIGGVRLENDYLITEKGSRNLCSLPLELEASTL